MCDKLKFSVKVGCATPENKRNIPTPHIYRYIPLFKERTALEPAEISIINIY